MTRIKMLMDEQRWTARHLAEKLGCTRFLLRHIMEHEPETNIQKKLAAQVLDILDPGAAHRAVTPKGR